MIWTRTHTAIMGGAACAVAVVVAAVVSLAPTRDAVARTGGPAVSIAVVDPREPVVTPGGKIRGVVSVRDALPRELDLAVSLAQFHDQVNDALG